MNSGGAGVRETSAVAGGSAVNVLPSDRLSLELGLSLRVVVLSFFNFLIFLEFFLNFFVVFSTGDLSNSEEIPARRLHQLGKTATL